jgi:MATE family multidrug resistance protein
LFLLVAAAFQLFDALQVTAQMSLRGLKDTMIPMWIAVTSYWVIGFALSYYLAFAFGMQGLGVWIGLLVSLIIAGAGMLWRWEVVSRRSLS